MTATMTHGSTAAATRLAGTKDGERQQSVVRDSFHSLIGDFWLAAIMHGYFSTRVARMDPVPPIFMWDTEIPLPNPHTAVAWYLTLENPIEILRNQQGRLTSTRRFGVALPESIDPYNWHVQEDSPTATMAEDYRLIPHHSITHFLPNDFRRRLAESGRTRLPQLYHPEQHIESTVMHCIDNRNDIDEDDLRDLAILRNSLMSGVIVQPRMPMTLQSTEIRGIHLRPWAQHGIYVRKPSQPDGQPYDIAWESPIRLASNLEEPVLTNLPTGVPALWMGFSGTDESAKLFMEAYFRVRASAVNQLLLTDTHPGVTNPSWITQIRRRGLAVESAPGGKGKNAKQSITSAALAAMDLSSIFDSPINNEPKGD